MNDAESFCSQTPGFVDRTESPPKHLNSGVLPIAQFQASDRNGSGSRDTAGVKLSPSPQTSYPISDLFEIALIFDR